MQKTVIARLVGGIGNQLFVYSIARRIAIENNAELVLDIYSGFAYDNEHKQYFHLDRFKIKNTVFAGEGSEYVLSRPKRFILRLINRILPFRRRFFITQKGRNFDSRLLDVQFNHKLYIEGYWQSEMYFKSVESIIRKELSIIPPEDKKNKDLSLLIQNCNSVAIHLRYFDNEEAKMSAKGAPNLINGHSFLEEYYFQSISKIKTLIKDPHFFIFSDKPEFSSKFAEKNKINFTVIDHNTGYKNAYADLWLMSLCKNFIIANSTFSWWGAWLCSNKEKTVIVPGTLNNKVLDAWSFPGLIPDGWFELHLRNN
jgi:hypothetical protein